MTLTPTTRASLFLRLRDSQDHEAWVEFVSLYEPVTYRLLRRYGLQDADAREVMQDLFMAVSRSVDRWDPAEERGSFRGWLRRIGPQPGHQLVETARAARDCDRRLGPAGDAEQTARRLGPAHYGNLPQFDQELAARLFQRAAEQVRAEVQPATWQAFWETGVVGTSPAETAKKLGMSSQARCGSPNVASWPGCKPQCRPWRK